MVKCALCRGRVTLTKQLCNDCHVFKELMTRFGKDAVIVRLPMCAFSWGVRLNANFDVCVYVRVCGVQGVLNHIVVFIVSTP